jgi:hypothetical protein
MAFFTRYRLFIKVVSHLAPSVFLQFIILNQEKQPYTTLLLYPKIKTSWQRKI